MSLGQKSSTSQFNTFLPKGQNSVYGVHVLQCIGSGIFAVRTVPPTGLPTGASSGGVPEVTATLVSTGLYDIRFPATKSVDIIPAVSSSSGFNFSAYVNNQSGPSGSAQLEITRDSSAAGGASGVNLIQASGYRGYIPTGSKVMLQFFAAPTNDGLQGY